MASGPNQVERIGFISTRISGTDGVSLEIAKWATILERMGYDCYYIAGQLDRPADKCFLIEKADFQHPEIEALQQACFENPHRTRAVSETIRQLIRDIKDQLYEALVHLKVDLLVAQNCLTIPMNIPLGAALVEVILETGIRTVAHHHDFVWERQRFLVNGVRDYIREAFPPRLAEIHAVVINSLAGAEFSRRTGLPYWIIPNIMDFAHPPAPPDDYALDFRQTIGLADDDLLILQPTRVVQRKGIEHSIELVRRLNDPRAKLVITHSSDDEGEGYARRVREYADMLGVEIVMAQPWVGAERGTTPDGKKRYTIWDVYPHADLVTYPSTYEGFGNAFLEAIYFKKPVFCNRYAIYRTDIEPCGVRAVTMDGFLSDEDVERVWQVLNDEAFRREMVEHNYEVGRQYFSYERAENELRSILQRPATVGRGE